MLEFDGGKKIGTSIFGCLEKRLIDYLVPKVPRLIRSHHLTLASIPISILIIAFSFLARENDFYLWAVSVMIAAQWLTDSLDGAVGRFRKEGLVRWGYYMDHFLDYIFLASILVGYMILLPDHFKYLQFFILAIFGSFMVNSYLALSSTGRFRIAHLGIGPTEIRLIFILVNTMLFLFGKTYLAGALPYVLGLSFLALCFVVYQTQKEIWGLDMEKNKSISDERKGHDL
jgi:CDP-alcohol phosphatidyltransferase.